MRGRKDTTHNQNKENFMYCRNTEYKWKKDMHKLASIHLTSTNKYILIFQRSYKHHLVIATGDSQFGHSLIIMTQHHNKTISSLSQLKFNLY